MTAGGRQAYRTHARWLRQKLAERHGSEKWAGRKVDCHFRQRDVIMAAALYRGHLEAGRVG